MSVKQAAFFDLDKTILARSSGLALSKDFYREGLISARLLMRTMAAQVVYLLVGADEQKMDKMREKALALTKGWDKQKVADIVEEVMGDVLTPIIYWEALDLIRKHSGAGRPVYIVSSSPEEIVGPMAGLLGVDGFLASRAKTDDNGRYTGVLDFYCYGDTKAVAMRDLAEREGIDLAGSFAYSDSVTDLPMLEAVGHPVATNPDRDLAKIAAERGWEVLRFHKPVTLRKRIADMGTQKQAAVGLGAALTFAAIAGLVWSKRKDAERRFPTVTVPGGREVRLPVPDRFLAR